MRQGDHQSYQHILQSYTIQVEEEEKDKVQEVEEDEDKL